MIFYIASLVLITAIVAAFLVASDRRDQRERDERAELLQRIQAPYAAVAEHHAQATPRSDVSPGNMPMTDEEIAGMQDRPLDVEAAKRRAIEWMEAVENGTAQLQDGVLP